ncbi:urea transporter [Planosporangium flavigriseum]|uniref:Urea transporter n=1 Tax=Planosporangium flavigriseum TaxID=373681 RepID=A0A8J3PNU6_9ACTN|nr:urea transporter [Planosporangium flavigriseum]NJC66904.1 urea transporter [Planosporangium flavigriseum]GIG74351.1 urea transporter [Planosporangium flavigriseum]
MNIQESWHREAWRRAADRDPLVRFVDVNLRGASQVFLQNNPLTGLIILVAVCWGAISGRIPHVAIGAVVGLVVGTVTAMLLKVPRTPLRDGLYGFNPLLTGLAVALFLRPSPLMWLYLVIGAAATTVVTLAIGDVLKTWDVPPLTFPFVLTTWFLLLGAYQFARIRSGNLGPPSLPHPVDPRAAQVHVTGAFLTPSMLRDVSEVFLLANWVTGALILIALAVNSLWAAGFAVGGAVVSTLVALWFGASGKAISTGLYGFSAVLTAVALGCVFYRPSWRVVPYALLGVVFTVIVQAALNTALAPVGVAALTAPFVFATWLFLLPKRGLTPTRHRELPEHDVVGSGAGKAR